MSLQVEHVNKWFGQFQAIKDLSMEVREGVLFGFLGANGAGKTTTMRMILDLLEVREVPRRAWGYLPEERGLYPKMRVDEQLLFLARLNGLAKQDAEKALTEWLERFQISANRSRKIEELSKGNQQKVQFLATILHDPTILIMDEPFSGLDPVNATVLKEAFVEMHRRGKTILFSTHQLEQAEELCQEIVIINKGQSVVQGSVREIKQRSGRQVARLKLDNDPEAPWLEQLAGVQVTRRREDYIEMQIQAQLNPNVIVEAALQHGGIISRFELAEPSLTDIFIEKVGALALPDVPFSVLSAEKQEE